MMMVAAMAAVLWGTGVAMDTPKRARWIMIALLLLVVIAIQIIFPDGHPLREATGGDARLWAVVIALGGLIWGYGQVLRRVREKAGPGVSPVHEAPQGETFSDTELNRYARHIILREIGGPGQKALKDAKILVIGAGGLGAPALQYLAAAGVGQIGVIDDDVVDNSNLQRQVIHTDSKIGAPKVQSATEAMKALNPFITCLLYTSPSPRD